MLTARVVNILLDLLGSMLTARVVSILPGLFVDCWSEKYTTDVTLQCVVLGNDKTAGRLQSTLQ